MKKLENLLNKTNISISSNDTYQFDRFTVVELKDSKGHSAVGIARRSDEDPVNADQGKEIARGRAERALYSKLLHKRINSPLMG